MAALRVAKSRGKSRAVKGSHGGSLAAPANTDMTVGLTGAPSDELAQEDTELDGDAELLLQCKRVQALALARLQAGQPVVEELAATQATLMPPPPPGVLPGMLHPDGTPGVGAVADATQQDLSTPARPDGAANQDSGGDLERTFTDPVSRKRPRAAKSKANARILQQEFEEDIEGEASAGDADDEVGDEDAAGGADEDVEGEAVHALHKLVCFAVVPCFAIWRCQGFC